jgi:Nitrate and nitrite sensing
MVVAGSRSPSRGNPVVLILAAALVVVAPLGCTDDDRNTREDVNQGEAEQWRELGQMLEGTTGFVEALQTERTAASTWLMGFEDMCTGVSNAQARSATDKALSDLDELNADEPRGAHTAAALGPDALAELGALRAEVDQYQEPRNLTNAEAADGIAARYSTLISSYLDANETQIVSAIDDPDMREGAELTLAASRQSGQIAELVRVLTFSTVLSGGLDEPGEVTEVSALWDEISSAGARISSSENPTYAGVVDVYFPDKLHSDLQPIVESALAGDPISIAALLDVVSVSGEQSYAGLQDRLMETLDEQAEASS